MIASLALLLLVSNAPAAELQLTPREREAFEYLRRAESFTLPYIGIGGNYPGGYLALRILNRSRGADAAFKELVQSGTTAGRLYGLLGLYRTDPPAFRTAAAPLAVSDEQVSVLVDGCVLSPEAVREVVRSIASGDLPTLFFTPNGRKEEAVLRAEQAFIFRLD